MSGSGKLGSLNFVRPESKVRDHLAGAHVLIINQHKGTRYGTVGLLGRVFLKKTVEVRIAAVESLSIVVSST